jgi:AcrR family transcriptional regulator
MRDIARKAEVATGAAYYYYPSKEAIVMDFYRRASDEMQPKLLEVLDKERALEGRLRETIRIKLEHFAPDRDVLRTLLRNGADPRHPLSPFSTETEEIRQTDIAWFRQMLVDCGTRVPRDLEPELPAVLWFLQMGVIFFWVTDESAEQERTGRLLSLSSKVAASLIRLAGLPLMRPLRKTAVELIGLVKAEPRGSKSGPQLTARPSASGG